ncbi:hypothetical protein B9479_004836 [Cryptococcus floricola]|uniref:Uncharacterized protein n=1 Tax=Cryptococcus floricola TaxID=2591691 RepID=A0A5D3AUK2_9TREE|nr:hypothetical protein B9479_004836 [Cryptococcus floricola]
MSEDQTTASNTNTRATTPSQQSAPDPGPSRTYTTIPDTFTVSDVYVRNPDGDGSPHQSTPNMSEDQTQTQTNASNTNANDTTPSQQNTPSEQRTSNPGPSDIYTNSYFTYDGPPRIYTGSYFTYDGPSRIYTAVEEDWTVSKSGLYVPDGSGTGRLVAMNSLPPDHASRRGDEFYMVDADGVMVRVERAGTTRAT